MFCHFLSTRLASREASKSGFQASLQEASFSELPASEAPELQQQKGTLLDSCRFREISTSVPEVVASEAPEQPDVVDLSQQ